MAVKRSLYRRARGAAYTALTRVTGGVHPDALRLEYSIGICVVDNPLDVQFAPALRRPALTRKDCRDVAAGFVADPFLFNAGDEWHLFFEVYNWSVHRGEIGWATWADGRRWKYRKVVLREAHHLSYPLIFEHGSEIYMLPESGQAGCVRLYRGAPFPEHWEPVCDLLEGPFADATLTFHEGRWWLFACSAPATHDELRLFMADSPLGPWTEHRASPIVANDAMRARPAGKLIKHGRRLIRLAQDCGADYGTAVRAFEVHGLSPEQYAETELARSPILRAGAEPWRSSGMHHLDVQRFTDNTWLAAVDGWVRYKA